jgi:hypothetical protein
MSQYILKRNLVQDDGEVIKVGQPLPDNVSDDVIEIYLKKGIIRKKRAYSKSAPKVKNIGE